MKSKMQFTENKIQLHSTTKKLYTSYSLHNYSDNRAEERKGMMLVNKEQSNGIQSEQDN